MNGAVAAPACLETGEVFGVILADGWAAVAGKLAGL
jgi:hypothetical protein